MSDNKDTANRIPLSFPTRKSHLPSLKDRILLNQERKSNTDVLGSYTGAPVIDQYPEQDADDL